jgi:hypothetical protein
VIDEDLGLSGSGKVSRPGFLRLLTAICEKRVGAVFCWDASRLARNNREWYQLIDYCAAVNTLIIDRDGIYDPNNMSDRVYLGMKGAFSEYEVGMLRQRAQTARLEKLVEAEVLRVIEPAAIAAAEKAEQLFFQQQHEKEKTFLTALEQAEYKANRRFEQYNLVDPKNRLVAQTLEARWNEALQKVGKLEQQLAQVRQTCQPLSKKERQAIYQLAENLPHVWQHPKTDTRIKKRILKTLITEIMVDISPDNYFVISVHWAGGKHTQYRLKRRKAGERVNYLMPETEDIVRRLAEIASDQEIARVLNKLKCKTASGKSWNSGRVTVFRRKHQIPVFKQDEYDKKGLVNLSQAAELLKVYPTTVKRLIKAKIIEAKQVVRHSPWIIDKEQLQKPTVLRAIEALKKGKKIRLTENRNQLTL